MRRILALFLAVGMILGTGSVTAFAAQRPELISQTAVLMDLDSGQILFEKGMDEQKFPASITKIVTVYLSLIKGNPADTITVAATAEMRDSTVTHIALVEGEVVTLQDMQHAAMLMSANDACNVIAEHISGSQAKFVEEMNAFAKSVGAVNTNFTNAHGLPDDYHYSTAYDMALMLKKAMEEPMFRKLFSTTIYEMPANDKKPKRPFASQDDMLKSNSPSFYEGILGGKLGWTEDARHTKVTAAKRDGRTLIAVVMNSASKMDKYKDTAALFDYGFDQFIPYTITPQMVLPHTAKVLDGVNHVGDLDVFLSAPQEILLHRAIAPTDITFEIKQPESLTPKQAEEEVFPLQVLLPPEAEGLMYAKLPEIHLDTKLTPVMSKVEDVSGKEQLTWVAQETGRVIGKAAAITALLIAAVMLILLLRKYWILYRRFLRKRRIQRKKQAILAAQRQASRNAGGASPATKRQPPAPPRSGTSTRQPQSPPSQGSGDRGRVIPYPGKPTPQSPSTKTKKPPPKGSRT